MGLGAPASSTTSGSLTGNASQGTSQFKTTTPAFGLQPAPSTTSSLGSMGLGAPASSTTSGSLTGNASQGTSHFKTTTPAFGQPAPSTTSSLGSMGLGAPASSTTSGSLTGNASQGTSQFKTTTPAFGLQPAPSTTSSLGSMGLGAPASSTTSGSLTGNASQGMSHFKTTTPAFGQPAPSTTSSLASSMFGGSAFGATAPSTSGSLFGNAAQNTSLFGTTTSTFGQPATSATPGFGFGAPQTSTSMFGASTPQQAPGTGMFGATSTAFGQPRPQFGSFGATATPTGGGLFGQPQGTGLFGQTATPTAGSGLFGTSAFGAGPATSGTTIKFRALTGTDTMRKNGVSSTINTSHRCITCMKEYENKSLEELRLEDYAANRKGSQAGMVGFGATTQQSSIFSVPVSQQSTFNFGANQSKSLIGTSNTGTFTSTGDSIFGQNTQTKATSFGLPAQPISTAFGTGTAFGTSTSVYGQSQQKGSRHRSISHAAESPQRILMPDATATTCASSSKLSRSAARFEELKASVSDCDYELIDFDLLSCAVAESSVSKVCGGDLQLDEKAAQRAGVTCTYFLNCEKYCWTH
ncbi:nuclear pore complex protein DDB_G0274915-like isoform X2 [Ixodes scapularis]|uniref:nuclear pore complex protein DDB_G0274915-like isoform X2 n=1 Tax=Ixodes scapularis TaxID=6945 RepID=UPI001C38FC0A|nr:nuclear pore complex protein DDB_G0274915-like isoform X2 [Ixodes scapularis]